MGRFDFYPRLDGPTDRLGMRDYGRKEQNEKCGGSALAFSPVTPSAVADYHRYNASLAPAAISTAVQEFVQG
jgi:hypothetical protein